MAKLDDLLTTAIQKADEAKARVDADETVDQQTITDLRAEVARLQAIIDEGTATPAQEAKFQELTDKLAAIEAAQPPPTT